GWPSPENDRPGSTLSRVPIRYPFTERGFTSLWYVGHGGSAQRGQMRGRKEEVMGSGPRVFRRAPNRPPNFHPPYRPLGRKAWKVEGVLSAEMEVRRGRSPSLSPYEGSQLPRLLPWKPWKMEDTEGVFQ